MKKSNKKIALSMIFPVLMGWMTACTGSAEAFLEKAKENYKKERLKKPSNTSIKPLIKMPKALLLSICVVCVFRIKRLYQCALGL
jgi:hypothetical protein